MANPPDTAERAAAAMRTYVTALFDEMQQRMAHQRAVVLQCLEGLTGPDAPEGAARRALELEKAVREAIEVLEETKRSFKSKRLGELREKLAKVLVTTSE
jgi:hypothetical protein